MKDTEQLIFLLISFWLLCDQNRLSECHISWSDSIYLHFSNRNFYSVSWSSLIHPGNPPNLASHLSPLQNSYQCLVQANNAQGVCTVKTASVVAAPTSPKAASVNSSALAMSPSPTTSAMPKSSPGPEQLSSCAHLQSSSVLSFLALLIAFFLLKWFILSFVILLSSLETFFPLNFEGIIVQTRLVNYEVANLPPVVVQYHHIETDFYHESTSNPGFIFLPPAASIKTVEISAGLSTDCVPSEVDWIARECRPLVSELATTAVEPNLLRGKFMLGQSRSRRPSSNRCYLVTPLLIHCH